MARKEAPMVSIARANYENPGLERLLEPWGGMDHWIDKGDRVLLKVNLLQAAHPGKAITTHPALVREVSRMVLDVGGEPFIGDSPAGRFNTRGLKKAYRKSGLLKVAKELGIELNYDTSTTKLEIPDARRLKKAPFCNFVLRADKIIALPKIKTHSYQTMTLASKIMFGAIPGLHKAKYHSVYVKKKAFADMLLDVLSFVPPDLFVMDGILAMEGDGPGTSGIPVELGVIMASEHAVGMDIAVCRMLGVEPVGIPVLKRARLRGMWPRKIGYPLHPPSDLRYKGFKLPSSTGRLARGGKGAKKNPVITEKCVACGNCVEICPRKAITIPVDRAEIDYDKCIRCYCCHEICPAGAIRLEKP